VQRLLPLSTEMDRNQLKLLYNQVITTRLKSLFLSNSKFNANFVDHINVIELNNGGIIDFNGNHGHCEIPPGLSLNTNDVYFWPRERPLNEFGMIYVDLFICGNYARYYPDFWIKDVDTYSTLALAIGELVHVAKRTMALLALSELSRTYFVPED
jgi:hypothetical protein